MRARAMALGSLSQHRNETKVADFCSAPVDGSYAAVDKHHGVTSIINGSVFRSDDLGKCSARA